MASKVKFSIQVMGNGEFGVVDAKGAAVQEITSDQFARSLAGKTVKNAFTMPDVVVIESNPTWVCIGGRCYYIP